MVEALDGMQWQLPLTVEQQNEITPGQLAALILAILLRNDRMTPQERAYRVSYYPYQLSSIRGFEIVGHALPETPSFARKWNEAVAILQAKAWIMLDPTQGDRADFMMPTSISAASPATTYLT
ncbi:hypothetical protein BH11ARM2_BH11ARM2_38590 [soil metagenome]